MRRFLTYLGVFATSAVLQLMVFDSMHLGAWFNPLPYLAFVVLLPMNTRQIVMLAMGLVAGVFMDFFEGGGGLFTIVTVLSAILRRFMMMFTLGKDCVEEDAMPSIKSVGAGKFFRYAALMVSFHCLVYFSLESLTFRYLHLVLIKTAISASVTLLAVWLTSLLFTVRARKKM